MKLPAYSPLFFALLSAACDPSAKDLEVTATIDEASLSVKASAFGTAEDPQGTPSGTFRLSLTLGQFASSSSEVTVQQFAVVDATTQKALLSPVLVQASAQKVFNVDIAETERFVYTLNYDKPIKTGELCASKQVQITGTIFDGARGKTTPVTSEPITVSCP